MFTLYRRPGRWPQPWTHTPLLEYYWLLSLALAFGAGCAAKTQAACLQSKHKGKEHGKALHDSFFA